MIIKFLERDQIWKWNTLIEWSIWHCFIKFIITLLIKGMCLFFGWLSSSSKEIRAEEKKPTLSGLLDIALLRSFSHYWSRNSAFSLGEYQVPRRRSDLKKSPTSNRLSDIALVRSLSHYWSKEICLRVIVTHPLGRMWTGGGGTSHVIEGQETKAVAIMDNNNNNSLLLLYTHIMLIDSTFCLGWLPTHPAHSYVCQ